MARGGYKRVKQKRPGVSKEQARQMEIASRRAEVDAARVRMVRDNAEANRR